MRERVELEVLIAQEPVVTLPARAPQQGAQPGDQLLAGEGLGEVVIGPRLQAGDPLAHLRARSQHQDGRAIARRAQATADLEAVESGHQHVEHDGVMRVDRQRANRLAAGAS